MAMGMAVALVRPGFRPERSLEAFHLQAALPQEVGQDAVLQQQQLIGVQLHRHMTVTEVIGSLQKGEGIRCLHAHHRLGRGNHLHQGDAVGTAQQFTRLQGSAARQLQQQLPAAGAAAQAAQAGALIRRQRQLQGRLCAREPQTFHQHDRGLVLHAQKSFRPPGHLDQRQPRPIVSTATKTRPAWAEHGPMTSLATGLTSPPWRSQASLRFHCRQGRTIHQGGASAPLKWQRAFQQASGHCELPLLHTAGGLVGGDQLTITADLAHSSRALLTSVAAQKVYGTVGRSRQTPGGLWAEQHLHFNLDAAADLEWLPQELVLYGDGLFQQQARVELAAGASFLTCEVVRLGRTAAGEGLGQGRWRSALEVRRQSTNGSRWELVDRLELGGEAMAAEHGLAGQPVFGSLAWLAPQPLAEGELQQLLADCRADRDGLEGEMVCGALEQGLVARYRGGSSQAARHWFCRLWRRTRSLRGLPEPDLPRVWPFQERPFAAPHHAGSGGSERT